MGDAYKIDQLACAPLFPRPMVIIPVVILVQWTCALQTVSDRTQGSAYPSQMVSKTSRKKSLSAQTPPNFPFSRTDDRLKHFRYCCALAKFWNICPTLENTPPFRPSREGGGSCSSTSCAVTAQFHQFAPPHTDQHHHGGHALSRRLKLCLAACLFVCLYLIAQPRISPCLRWSVCLHQ